MDFLFPNRRAWGLCDFLALVDWDGMGWDDMLFDGDEDEHTNRVSEARDWSLNGCC